jgi:putative heme-binding domain-containing protein
VQKAALLLLDQPPRPKGRLGHEPVLRRVRAADADLRQTALRILERHPEWAEHAVGLLRDWLEKPQLAAEEAAGLSGLVVAFQGRRPVQELVGAAIGNRSGRTPANRRVLLLGTVAECTLMEPPGVWVEALAHALGDATPAVRMQALRAAAVLQAPRLDEQLTRIAENVKEPPEVRLEALRAVVLRRPKLSDRSFDFLLGRLGEAEAPLTRLGAAEVLGRGRLDDAQLARLRPVLQADQLIAPPLVLPALTRSATEANAPVVLRYLEESIRAGWRPTEAALTEVLQTLPAGVRGKAGPLRDLLRQGAATQAARLAQFEPLLDGGDAGRGRAVFFGAKVACAACHRVGPEGGLVGPDLTKIGAVRPGRDLLEAILFPSSTIAQGYDQYAVTTADDRIVSGVIARQSADTLVLRDASGAEVRLRKDQVERLERQSTSPMPDGLKQALAPEELRDLLAYLRSLR